jgi:enediyne biosynthesis protein E4
MRGAVRQRLEDDCLTMRAFLVLAALAGMAHAACAETMPKFVEETRSSGIDSVFAGDWEYMVGGGAAAFDCSGDGFPDLILAGGHNKASLYVNRSAQGGELKFEKQASGLELDKVLGTYPLDIDGDGRMDVVLLRQGENAVMRGMGECKFERANEAWGFAGGDEWSAAFAATWEKDADWPTLAIGNYIDRNEEISPWGSCTDNWLHRPEGIKRKFAKPLALKPSYCALSMLFTDWNRSGTPSLRISNDREYYEGGQEQLWHVEPGAAPRPYTEAEGWKPIKIWGMGIASSDVNGDGYPDYFLTSMADQRLQMLDGKSDRASFKEAAYAAGLTAHRPFTGSDPKPSTGWHAQFEDVNNDGRADLFVAKGNVDRMPDFALKDPNNLLIQGPEGKFKEMADKAGVASAATSRGAVMVDFNLDGLVDLVVVNRRETAQIWRNVTEAAGHWLQLALKQDGANRNAIGAWIEVRRGSKIEQREITSGGGHASGQSGWWHFGLADETKAELRVIWPGGEASTWQDVTANGFYVVERGKAPRRWTPK